MVSIVFQFYKILSFTLFFCCTCNEPSDSSVSYQLELVFLSILVHFQALRIYLIFLISRGYVWFLGLVYRERCMTMTHHKTPQRMFEGIKE
jgi:hypothetical protein